MKFLRHYFGSFLFQLYFWAQFPFWMQFGIFTLLIFHSILNYRFLECIHHEEKLAIEFDSCMGFHKHPFPCLVTPYSWTFNYWMANICSIWPGYCELSNSPLDWPLGDMEWCSNQKWWKLTATKYENITTFIEIENLIIIIWTFMNSELWIPINHTCGDILRLFATQFRM